MKRLLLLLTTALAAVSAGAFDIGLDIDDASRVEVYVDDVLRDGIVNGDNSIEIAQAPAYVTLKPTAGNKLVAIYDRDHPTWDEFIDGEGNCNIYVSASAAGTTWKVETASASDVRTASATVTVDEASKVTLTRGSNPVVLTDGDNTVPFDPATESEFAICPSSVDGSIYRITLNGATASSEAFTTRVTVADGDRIGIEANWPDVEYDVTINVTGDYADDRFISNVYVDGTPVAGDLYSFKAKAGSELTIGADTQNWEVTAFTINGEQGYFGSTWRHTVSDNTTLDFTVRRYSTIRVTVMATPDVTVFRGHHYNGDIIELDPATSTAVVDLRRDTPILSFRPLDGNYINYAAVGAMKANDFAPTYIYPDDDLKTAVLQVGSLAEGDVVKVSTAAFDRSATSALIICDYDAVKEYIGLTDALGTQYPLAEGANQFEYDRWVSPFVLELGGPFTPYVYMGTTALSPFSGIQYELPLVGNDVVKVFADNQPSVCSVALNISDEATGKVAVTADGLVPVDAGTTNTLTGTVLDIRPVDTAEALYVTAGGNELESDADGSISYTVTGDISIDITTAQAAGIAGITVDGNAPAPLYNLQGVRVDSDNLPAGLYIRADGTKVLVK